MAATLIKKTKADLTSNSNRLNSHISEVLCAYTNDCVKNEWNEHMFPQKKIFHSSNTCFFLLPLSVLTSMTLTGTVITSLVHCSYCTSVSPEWRWTNQAFMHKITVHRLCPVSFSLKQIHMDIRKIRALFWSPFSSHQMEKILFYQHL